MYGRPMTTAATTATRKCTRCNGTGVVAAEHECPECEGFGTLAVGPAPVADRRPGLPTEDEMLAIDARLVAERDDQDEA